LQLDNQIGGGGRLGYFFTDVVSAELDAGYQSPNPRTGSVSPTLAHGSASLVLNFGTAATFYILGATLASTSRRRHPTASLTTPVTANRRPDLSRRPSRAPPEVRGFYTPNTGFAGGDWAGHVVGSLGLVGLHRSGRQRTRTTTECPTDGMRALTRRRPPNHGRARLPV